MTIDNREKSIYQKPLVCIGLALVCCILWGSAFPCIKVGYQWFNITDTGSRILFAGYRFTLAGLMTLAFGMITDAKAMIPKAKMLVPLAGQGVIQTTLQYALFYTSLAYTTGSKGSVLTSTSAFFTIIVAHFVYKAEKMNGQKIAACLLGFAGVIILNIGDGSLLGGFTMLGEGAMILSAMSAGLANVTAKAMAQRMSSVAVTGYQLTFGGIILIAIGLAAGGRVTGFTVPSVILLIYMAVISSVAFSLWTLLIKHNGASKISVYNFTIPIFGVLMSAVFLGEHFLSAQNIIALAFVCAGVVIVNKSKSL